MQKRMLLLFVFLSPSVACAMEDKFSNFFSSWRSYRLIPTVPVPLSPMQEVQKSKNEFEELLRGGLESEGIRNYYYPEDKFCLNDAIRGNSIEFLIYCYNQRFHAGITPVIDAFLFDRCKEVRINGYSALGAAIIAKYVCVENQCNFIRQLMQKGFTFTEKDKTLLALLLYKAIPAEQKKIMISLLHGQQENDFFLLPFSARRIIVDYIMCLCPEKKIMALLIAGVL